LDKLLQFIDRVKSANGPAQIVSYSFWGVLIAGMLWDFCEKCIPQEMLIAWACISGCVLVSAIWFSRKITIYTLVADMVLSAVIMCIYFMHEPEYVSTMVYNVAADGTYKKLEHSVSEWFTALALLWMTFHSLYLANLLQRQELEHQRAVKNDV
jgi:hypothetical protein